jgi:DNA-directed RNA polymerase subunit P
MMTMAEENFETETIEETPVESFDVVYSCLRCGTNVSNTELSRLPEIKCICGFRVFTKVRPPIVKTVKAI